MKETMTGDELLQLKRVSALLERASSLTSVARLRSGPFPAAQDDSPFQACARDLSREIERIDAEDQRARILRQLQIIRSTIAPVRRLPNELLSEVFAIAVYGHHTYERAFVARILAAVCAIWRATACDTANFWTCIDLSLATRKNVRALLDMHVDLANGLLLRVCQRPRVNVDEQMRRLLDLPSKYTVRLEQISFRGNEVAFPVRETPDLSSLVHVDLRVFGQNVSRALAFLCRARALCSLSLHLEYPCRFQSYLSIPTLPNLTELKLIKDGEPNDWVIINEIIVSPVLKGCAASLQRLIFSNHEEIGWQGERIILPALRCVDLQYGAHHLLSHVHAPALETVILRETRDPFVPLRHIIKSSKPPICTLDLVFVNGSRRHFSVAEVTDNHPLIHTEHAPATCSKSNEPIVPALTSLRLQHRRKVYHALVQLDVYLA
ncbi:hypothetical protein BD626DRAFT_528916 [Schizophyllum amplum]|uniref:F-box domain-containing protein n=1 Tax=Schizophyllum amplum TaxID=97359 RepID=A0A550BRZ4_9AGAR|nr:hypothetical protein BD626DRAFT_528916 [Auriculariopsis ampla]